MSYSSCFRDRLVSPSNLSSSESSAKNKAKKATKTNEEASTSSIPTLETIIQNSPGRVTRRYAAGLFSSQFFSHHSFLLISFFFYSRLAMLQRGEGTSTQPTVAASPTKQKTAANKSPARKLARRHLRDWRLIELSTPSLSNSCTCELSVCDPNVPAN